jgi:hypothetical protein
LRQQQPSNNNDRFREILISNLAASANKSANRFVERRNSDDCCKQNGSNEAAVASKTSFE